MIKNDISAKVTISENREKRLNTSAEILELALISENFGKDLMDLARKEIKKVSPRIDVIDIILNLTAGKIIRTGTLQEMQNLNNALLAFIDSKEGDWLQKNMRDCHIRWEGLLDLIVDVVEREEDGWEVKKVKNYEELEGGRLYV